MRLRSDLVDAPELTFSVIPEGYRHIHHTFVTHFDGSVFGACRDDLLDILVNEYRIRAIVQYYPLYRYPLFQKFGAGDQDCPVMEAWWDDSFSLPWWSGIPDDTLDYVVSSVKGAISQLRGQ
jgi:dTDP-4-amino-4,6-dideoxygalactose transaminase